MTPRFTSLEEATSAEMQSVELLVRDFNRRLPDRVLAWLAAQKDDPTLGMPINTFQHCLQAASRAARDGADEELVVCALLHDAGESLAPHAHGEWAESLLRPFVSDTSAWILRHHPEFQGYYFWHKIGEDRQARERYRGHVAFAPCVEFCARWDQVAFDPAYSSLPLESFEPAVRRVLTREPRRRSAVESHGQQV